MNRRAVSPGPAIGVIIQIIAGLALIVGSRGLANVVNSIRESQRDAEGDDDSDALAP
jgi:hypothetical protein